MQKAFAERNYLITLHGATRAAQRLILTTEIAEAVLNGHVIEDYPDDKYGPSCLILGVTKTGRMLHVQVSYPESIKVITIYEPSPEDWDADGRTRKSHE
ncbi:MAG: DUF4258 domain-containing protein [Anaerolineae bacterium]|nr:DUF4258 domain-containing protein [Anaerolineae bacterium]